MKDMKAYSNRLALALVTIILAGFGFAANAQTADGGASLVPISTKFKWVAAAAEQDSYIYDSQLYVAGSPLTTNTYSGHFGVYIKASRGIGFKLATGRDYQINIKFIAAFTDDNRHRGVGLKRGDTFGSAAYVANLESNGQVQTLEYRAQNITDEDNTFWVTGHEGFNIDGYLLSFEIIPHIAPGYLTAINSDYTWRNGDSGKHAETLMSNAYSAGAYHFGSEKTISTSGDDAVLWNAGGTFYTFDLNGSAIAFKIDQGKKGVAHFTYREGGSLHLYQGADYAEAVEQTLTRVLFGNGAATYRASYPFDTTDGAQVFWIDGDCMFGGFEVMVDSSDDSGAASLTTIPATGLSWEIKDNYSTDLYTNYPDKTYTRLPSGAVGTYCYLAGPSMTISDFSNRHLGESSRSVLFTSANALGMKLPADKLVTVRLYFFGETGSGLTFAKGATPASASAVASGVANSHGDYWGQNNYYDVPQFQTGSEDEIYWIKGLTENLVYFAGYEVTVSELPKELMATTAYNLWTAGGTLTANDLADSNRLFYQGAADKAESGTTLNVLGLQEPSYTFTDGTDYAGIKIPQGRKGKIKAYYTGTTAAQEGTPVEIRDRITVGYGGWSADYDRNTHVITYTDNGGAHGWYNENYDYSDYTHLEIVLTGLSDTEATFGIWANFNSGYDVNGNRINEGDNRPDNEKLTRSYDSGSNTWRLSYVLHPSYKDGYSQICITCDRACTVTVQSAKLVNYSTGASATAKVLNGGSDTDHTGATQVASASGLTGTGCTVTEIAGTNVLEYSFDTSSASTPQIYWVTGDMKLAAIEVLYDEDNSSDIIWWYVNPDCKMIVGSESYDKNIGGVTYDEVATYYVSKGRKAKFCFFMPYTMQCLYDKSNDASFDVVTDNTDYSQITWSPMGTRSCWVEIKNGGNESKRYYPKRFDNGNLIKIGSSSKHKTRMFRWNGEEDISPYTMGTTPDALRPGLQNRTFSIIAHEGSRTHKVHLTFIYIDAPVISATPNTGSVEVENEDVKDDIITHYYDSATSLTISIAPGDNTDDSVSSAPIYYTMNSNDPDDLMDDELTEDQRFATRVYDDSNKPVLTFNGIVSAAQYITTGQPFYTDGIGSPTSRRFKLISEDLLVNLKDVDNMIYVKKPSGGFHSTLTNDGVFSNGRTDFAAGSVDCLKGTDSKDIMHFMYGTTNVKYFYTRNPGPASSSFRIGGVKWDPSGAKQDWSYETFIDAFKFHMEGTNDHVSAYNDNGNPYTECNLGIGGARTEDGGMFLTPVSADFFRFEPEYDGVATLWVRQNGSTDDSTMDDGGIYRRPIYIMDENGRVMRATTIKPTADHHLAIDGVYAINSGRSEYRYDFDLTWKYGTYGMPGWNSLDTKSAYVAYSYRFQSLPEIPSTGPQGADADGILGRNYDAYRFMHHSSYPLYRDDTFAAWEDSKGVSLNLSKYGFEVPNYTYMRYRIPVKAGKTYYLGGRGTKNGFVGVQFEVLDANYNNRDYRRADNPTIAGNGQHGPLYDWDFSVTGTKSYNYSSSIATYASSTTVPTYVLDGNQPDIRYVASSKVTKGSENLYWWEDGAVDILQWQGHNPLVGTTINVELRREMKADNWYPIVLPFSVSETRMTQYFGEGVQVLYLDPKYGAWFNENGVQQSGQPYRSVYRPAVNGTKLNFTNHKYQMLYANTPAFICPTFTWTDGKSNHPTVSAGKVTSITFERVNYAGGEIKSYEIGNGYEVTGSYLPTSASDNGAMYMISNETDLTTGDPVVVVYHAPNGADMKGTRVWVHKKTTQGAPLHSVGFSDFTGEDYHTEATTGIVDIVYDKTTIDMYNNDNVYDLTGRIVGHGSLQGLQKGVYIFHGEKVYIR